MARVGAEREKVDGPGKDPAHLGNVDGVKKIVIRVCLVVLVEGYTEPHQNLPRHVQLRFTSEVMQEISGNTIPKNSAQQAQRLMGD